ncbi:hypothetical protein IQ07DRAFT_319121 [Pyrenochaeta sp. DS3sAY3a]|nr:hypothetical protein IQ07DRAFT_319121 [Pyrenochaeta sp. DS3sAY3a]
MGILVVRRKLWRGIWQLLRAVRAFALASVDFEKDGPSSPSLRLRRPDRSRPRPISRQLLTARMLQAGVHAHSRGARRLSEDQTILLKYRVRAFVSQSYPRRDGARQSPNPNSPCLCSCHPLLPGSRHLPP